VHRVAQEALTNVLKHADSPRRVEVVLRYLEARSSSPSATTAAGPAAAATARARAWPGCASASRCTAARCGRAARGGGYEVSARVPVAAARDPGVAGVNRVFLVDDQALVRGGLRMVIDSQPDMTVVGEAQDGREAARATGSHHRRHRADGRPHAPPRRRRGDRGCC
jgi:hypothetical protein